MRSLTVKQYKSRLEQFESTFESSFPKGSNDYTVSLHYAFKKSLNEDDIVMPVWLLVSLIPKQ